MSRGALVSCLLAALLASTARAEDAEREVGRTYWVGQAYFQYLGQDARGNDVWLYPHTDGVPEVFTDEREVWEGNLDSRYDPVRGLFDQRFNAGEVLNELLSEKTPKARKVRAARLLAVFAGLHPAPKGPYYLREERGSVGKYLRAEGRAWVAGVLKQARALLARVPSHRTKIHEVPRTLVDSDAHYGALIADGYLDVAVIGGNSLDEETGKYHSWNMVADLQLALKRQGFHASSFRRSDDQTLCEKTVRMCGQRVRVRVQLTGGSHRKARVRRAVANFVEGLARADVVIYLGHSNHGTGNYYLSESKTSFSRFRMGNDRTADLERKCHELGSKRHQILALQSCSSYQKYVRPIRAFYEAQAKQAKVGGLQTVPGFLGTTDICYFEEFAPRYSELLSLLLAGAGPREISRRVNAIKFGPKTPTLLLRGVLQARHSFVVPEGVEIGAVRELGAGQGFLAVGSGSDGRDYDSTAVFPQDEQGEIAQVVRRKGGLYGLGSDGRIYTVGRDTGGIRAELTAVRESGHRISFMTWATRKGRRRLHMIDAEGTLLTLSSDAARLVTAGCQAPGGVRFVAIGNTDDGRFVGVDAQGGHRVWERHLRKWSPIPPVALPTRTPSLNPGHGGRLWVQQQ